MSESRRDFLKKAGACTLVGLGVAAAVEKMAVTDATASSAAENGVTSGTRWGMVIDMGKCTDDDCSACTDACHVAHNVPTFEDKKHEVKWLWKENYENAFPHKSQQFVKASHKEKPFLTTCNHCEDPPCVRVCPTQATFKRPDGIVQMDFHRCIGCRFCMAGCPYGSRSFNWLDPRPAIKHEIHDKFPTRERGVVEKCNFCAEQLRENKSPHCVDACPEGVITFGDLNDPESEVRKLLDENHTIQRKAELGTGPSVFYIV